MDTLTQVVILHDEDAREALAADVARDEQLPAFRQLLTSSRAAMLERIATMEGKIVATRRDLDRINSALAWLDYISGEQAE